ncbi:OLC1v1035823C2 [Oldenlandia corymbosa var. corymbosa]|uniref:OLC1v1035823C2 n=1 Tax=Oldenlandia corymbosa var. corymbosa TaxID=529605 RepID=A0AAV1CX32_OLDCO|nr:OLC1v1035823C2 [Oldenlandia corymbosa var. corymbosa]
MNLRQAHRIDSQSDWSIMMAPRKGTKCGKDGSNPENEILLFFKPFITHASTNRLMLPLNWTEYMKGNLPNKVLLRDRFGNFWHVVLGHEEEKTYFLGGWTRFVKQNYLGMGDMLVFKYDGIRIFDVKIFGSDSCDKRGVGRLIYKIKEEVEEEEPLGVGDKCDHVREKYDEPEAHEEGEKEVQPHKEYKNEMSEVEIMENINLPVSSQSPQGTI